MTFLIVFACTAVACCALRNPLRKVPWLFYVLAVAFDALYFASDSLGLPQAVDVALLVTMNKCLLPAALFAVVMYIGVFPRSTKARHWLQPLRTPLSIVACILVLGHMVRFFENYAARVLGGGAVSTNVMASFVIGIVLFALLAVLGVTSFNFVRKRMGGRSWKRVQLLAYPFYALVYVHLLIMLGPAALRGGDSAVASVVVYTAVFGLYAVLRVARAIRERHEPSEAENEAAASVGAA